MEFPASSHVLIQQMGALILIVSRVFLSERPQPEQRFAGSPVEFAWSLFATLVGYG